MSDTKLRSEMLQRALLRGAIIVGIAIAIALIVLGLTGSFIVDWLWFGEVGYLGVFWTIVFAETEIFAAVFVATGLILWLNGWLAARVARPLRAQFSSDRGGTTPQSVPHLLQLARHRVRLPFLIAGSSTLVALLVAWGELHNWSVVLRFLHQVPAHANDPVYGNDIGFYLFSLPAYVAIKNWMLITLLLSTLLAGAVYWFHGDIEFDGQRHSISPVAIAHGSALLGCYFAVKAWSYGLDRYLLLYGDNGVVVGASYTDIHVELPILWLLIGLAVTAALACWANLRIRSPWVLAIALIALFGSSLVLGEMLPALVQRIYVKPNELQLERPYIQNNIALTQQSYNLHQITVEAFTAEQSLTAVALDANRPTIDNIRLWDWQPLMDTYSQLQEIRTYYKFHDVDIDRYWLNDLYQAVMLSARELKPALLPANAQTWVNRHLIFTHGNGVVMSPVTQKSVEGLPLFYLRDIPPVATGGPEIREPRIYYGEETDDYVIANGGTPEFDYPKGKDNAYASYDGTGGIPVGGILRKTLFAWYFNDPNLLLSTYITGQSRIMIRRTIQERARMIAPFLSLDRDPYLVVSDGRLFWIQDAYTTSTYFPYAQAFPERGLNYIRNAVKIVTDAYNGTVDFFLVDNSDVVAATYQGIFPDLFKPLTAMSEDLQTHIRYPEDLFGIQAQMYRAYHMDNPEVFYNREDLWQLPRQPEGGPNARMVPYYIVMRLPGEPAAQFFLMLPMVPSQRENMIAWLAARCDPPNYGKLVVYEFPKDKLVYGPFQIEARINQNTDISQQLTLWNQLGSRVIRGNMLVVPIENSILYVSPLYLRAEQGQLPELKRVIAAYGDHVVMKETLADALAALFTESGPELGTPSPGLTMDRAREALRHYGQAIERLKSGDWAGFGTELDAMRGLLQEMSRQSESR